MNLDINYHNKNLVNTLSKDLIYDQMWKHKLKHGTIIYLDNDYLTESFHARKVDDEKALLFCGFSYSYANKVDYSIYLYQKLFNCGFW